METFSQSSLALGIILVSICYLILGRVLFRWRKSQSLPLPPGPFRWPILGNALQIPQTHTWLTYTKWAKLYGDIVYLEVVGQPLVILNSANAAKDLLDKRSSIYSDRPHLTMAGELSGYGKSMILEPYGNNWRKQRKMTTHDFAPTTVARYYPLQETEARKLIRSVLMDPTTLFSQTKFRIGTIIIRVNYGYYLRSEEDSFLTTPLIAMENFSQATAPGAWLVDFIPPLKYLPQWMPGSGFLRKASEWKQIAWNASYRPYVWSKNNMASGTALMPNVCSTFLASVDGKPTADDEEQLIWATSALLGGGLDTNMSTALTFFLAMVLYPDIQAKARAEIDSVVGVDRLPSIADRASLPFIRSLITEVYRWNPAIPLGIPHSLTRDDAYDGVYLPKGSIIMPNVWNMLHDPEIYPNPMEFNPDRYQCLDSEMRKVTDLSFGFGRRACPGFHFAEGTIFAIVTTALAACEIVPVVDETGIPVLPEVAYTSGAIVLPKSFRCNLKCRSNSVREMLELASSHVLTK